MPTAAQIIVFVEDDVMLSYQNTFPPTGAGFRLLEVGDDFTFLPGDVPDDAGVTVVAWQYSGIHSRPLAATMGVDYNDRPIPIIDPTPAPPPAHGRQAPQLPLTNRPVTITGTTLVVTRELANPERPMLLRFIDWADVFTQLGFVLSTCSPEPEEAMTGFQRLDDAARHGPS